MKVTSTLSGLLKGSSRREKAREARRRRTLTEFKRRRLFEALEQRQMLDAASLLESLPEAITIAESGSYHYAYEGVATPDGFVDDSSVDGLTASILSGEQVAFKVWEESSTSGAVSCLGEVVIQLFNAEGEAPNSSAHFMSLVYDGYYEDLTFHRIWPGFMFQGGSSDGYGYDGSGVEIADEYSDVLTHSSRGIVAYANKGPNTSDAQFYITFDATPNLDGRYNVFGYVVDGYDVLDKMEAQPVSVNPISGEKTFPDNMLWMTDVRVLAQDDVSDGALRLVADDDASGVTTLSFVSTGKDGELAYQETTVYVGDAGLDAYVQSALHEYNFELTAGESLDVQLPTSFGGYAVKYTIGSVTEAQGYTIASDDPYYATFSLQTEEGSAQYTTLKIDAELVTGVKCTVYQPVFISPSAPGVALEGTSATVVAELEGEDAWITNGNLGDYPLVMVVTSKTLDSSYTTETPIVIKVDDVEYVYDVLGREYNEETQVATYRLSLQCDGGDFLTDGLHMIAVQQYLPIDRVTDHERLYSDYTFASLLVDTEPLAFTTETTTFALHAGDSGVVQLHTNKADASGVEREDVRFRLANPEAGPRFIELTENGAFSWGDITSEDAGTFYVDVEAVDALGAVAELKLTLNVDAAPVFDELTEVEATTGEKYEATVVARVPGAETPIRYELVGDARPAGFTFDGATGAIVWDIPSDYLPTNVKGQAFEFSVKAIAQIEREDGTFVDGPSTTKAFTIDVQNASYDDDRSVAPEWSAIDAQSTKAGETFTTLVEATVPETCAGVRYQFDGAVPTGMTIGETTGAIYWNVPSDYFTSDAVPSKTIEIGLNATTIVSTTETGVNYGESSKTSFKLTIVNPDFVDHAPEFAELENTATSTGSKYETSFSAVDPDGLAESIAYELIGADYPGTFSFDAAGQKFSWDIPEDYLESNVSAQIFRVTIRATERVRAEDGSLNDGRSTDKTFELMVANAKYDAEKTIAPVFSPIAAQSVKSGETLEATVVATAESAEEGGEESVVTEYEVEYALVGERPDGMTIDATSGKIVWNVPEDYFVDGSTESETVSVSVQAKTVLAKSERSTDYSGAATETIEITVVNSKYDPAPKIDDWREWFDAWVDAAQARNDGLASNLSDYLSAYLQAVDERAASLKAAQADYAAGKSTLTEFLQKRDEVVSDYNDAVADARAALRENDAQVEADYAKELEGLNAAYDKLSQDETLEKPENIREDALAAAEDAVQKADDDVAAKSNLRIKNDKTGASVATDLASVLKLWRQGYTYETVYDSLYSDPNFVQSIVDEPEPESEPTQDPESTQDQESKPEGDTGDVGGGDVVYTLDENGNLVPVKA